MELEETRPIDSAFNRSGEGGQALRCGWESSDDVKEMVVRVLIEDARRHLPEGAIFEIRGQQPPLKPGEKVNYGRRVCTDEERLKSVKEWGIAWYYAPAGHYNETKGELVQYPVSNAQLVHGLYFLIGRYQV